MDIAAVIAAWLMVIVVLIASGVGKLRHPEGAAEAFRELRVPALFNRALLIRAHPWAEMVLALFMALAPHPFSSVAAALALALFTAYLFLIGRVVAKGQRASCNCFGSIGSARVDRWTLVRNVLLWLMAGVVLVDALLGSSMPERIAMLGQDWWWVAALALAATMTALVTRDAPAKETTVAEGGEPEADYLRLPIPDVPVRVGASGEPVSLRELAKDRAQVLVMLSPACAACRLITGKLAGWAEDIPEVDLRVVNSMSHGDMMRSEPRWAPFYVEEVEGSVVSVFGIAAWPSAMVLGADGLMAGGPVMGIRDIEQLMRDVHDQIAEVRR